MDLVMCLGMSLCLYLVRACVWFSVSVSGSGSGGGGCCGFGFQLFYGAPVYFMCVGGRGVHIALLACVVVDAAALYGAMTVL